MSDIKLRYLSSIKNLEPDYKWVAEVNTRLEKLKNLEQGWDGYRGKPVSLENANVAIEILKRILLSPNSPAPQIVPGVNGDLQMEWHTHAIEIEIDVLSPNNSQVWIRNQESYPDGIEFTQDEDFTVLKQQIREMKERSSEPLVTLIAFGFQA